MTSAKRRILGVISYAVCLGAAFMGCTAHTRVGSQSTNTKAGAATSAAAPFIKDITPEQAKGLLRDGGFIYVDVRTVEEFVEGHPSGATNIPFLFQREPSEEKVKNERFLSVMQASFPPDSRLIVGCRSGRRSAAACKVLQEAGYKRLWNMLGGFSGKKDRSGEVIQQGWSALGYPVQTGDGGDRSYESVSKE